MRNEAMRAARQFKVPSSRFKVMRISPNEPIIPHPALSRPTGEGGDLGLVELVPPTFCETNPTS